MLVVAFDGPFRTISRGWSCYLGRRRHERMRGMEEES